MGARLRAIKGKKYYCYKGDSFLGIATFNSGFFINEFSIIDGVKIFHKRKIHPDNWHEVKRINFNPSKINL